MADPYNPYTSYSTPAPGGVSYYPPEDQRNQPPAYAYQQQPYQPPYTEADGQPEPNYTYAAHPSPYHLTPEPYQGGAAERSYTPVGQPDHLGPVTNVGMPPVQGDKVPENMGYYGGHPADQPRFTPSPSPHPPSVHVSKAEDPQGYDRGSRPSETDADLGSERGMGATLAGGAAGYFLGHKKEHGLLGAIGGAIVGNLLENKMKDHGRHEHGHHHEHLSGHGHHHHHHHRHGHSHSRSRSGSRHRGENDF
ncbi:hypothetical protein N7462_005538 [Penicillium macrosclerotiorum]|uniref:uncharacterized protein n=1 Tax=Penicillium macrosclerotiorum TaxID=303699 RepID=UPI002546E87D|nr:uncharacterized protein N7462_005538 [Penicillium macrosclerotiorum]KAJ5682373.1 hypothetical protein N7462_005538 [Penicillium macrosclerotiorum]